MSACTDSVTARYSSLLSPKWRYSTVLDVPASVAISSMPTPEPCRRIARSVASTSSVRRVWRCSSQRVLRPSAKGRRKFMTPTVPDTSGTC